MVHLDDELVADAASALDVEEQAAVAVGSALDAVGGDTAVDRAGQGVAADERAAGSAMAGCGRRAGSRG